MDHSQNLALVVKSINPPAQLRLMSNSVLFTIYQQPSIQSVQPDTFYAMYPPDVEISGKEFVDMHHMKCRMNDQIPEARRISDSKVACLFSQMTFGSLNNTWLYLNGIDFISTRVELRVIHELNVVSVQPISGTVLGGIKAIVTGVGFHASLCYSCIFGLDSVEANFADSTSVSCITPYAPHPSDRTFSLCLSSEVCVDTNTTYTFVEPLQLVKVTKAQTNEGWGNCESKDKSCIERVFSLLVWRRESSNRIRWG
jgi:hypothetical protein